MDWTVVLKFLLVSCVRESVCLESRRHRTRYYFATYIGLITHDDAVFPSDGGGPPPQSHTQLSVQTSDARIDYEMGGTGVAVACVFPLFFTWVFLDGL